MSNLCPQTGTRVTYLVCQECEAKICRQHYESRQPSYVKNENMNTNKTQSIDKVKDDKH